VCGKIMYKLSGYDLAYSHPDYSQLMCSPDPCAIENTKYLIATFLTEEEAIAYVDEARLRHPQASGFERSVHEFKVESPLRHYKKYEIIPE